MVRTAYFTVAAMLLLTAFWPLVDPAHGAEKESKIKTLIVEYIKDKNPPPQLDPRPFDIREVCEKDPQTGVRVVGETLAHVDISSKDGGGQIASGMSILSGLTHPDSIKELDKLYRRASGDKELRRVAITALNRNGLSLMLSESLIRQLPGSSRFSVGTN